MKKSGTDFGLTIFFNFLLMTGFLVRSAFLSRDTQQSVSLAYLDPSTGTMIISAIIGILATVALGVKTFWYKISSIFKSKKKN
jgi:hypothetical protein